MGGRRRRGDEVISVEESIRDCANRERRERGMRTLKHDPALDAAARMHARRMLKGLLRPRGSRRQRARRPGQAFAKRRYVIVGENIAAGFDSTGATCRGWMNSPGHRANILRASFTRIGAGYASGDSEYGRYYVQVFADVPG